MMEKEFLTPQELVAMNRAAMAKQMAQLQAQLQDANYAKLSLELKVKYGLGDADKIDLDSGAIVRFKVDVEGLKKKDLELSKKT